MVGVIARDLLSLDVKLFPENSGKSDIVIYRMSPVSLPQVVVIFNIYFLSSPKAGQLFAIIVNVIKPMSQHSFFELFTWNTKTAFTFVITPTEVLIVISQYRRKLKFYSQCKSLSSLSSISSFITLMTPN